MLDFVNVGITNLPLCRGHTGPLRYKWAGRLSRSKRTSADFSHTWGMGPGFYRKMCWKYLKRISSVGFCVFLMNLRQAMQSSMATSLYTFSVTNLCSFDLRCKPRWKGLHPSNFEDIQVYVGMKKFHWNITSKSKVISPPTHSVWSRCQRLPCSRGWCWATPLQCTGPLAPRFPLPPSMLQQIQYSFQFFKRKKWFYRCCRLLHCPGPGGSVCSWQG